MAIGRNARSAALFITPVNCTSFQERRAIFPNHTPFSSAQRDTGYVLVM